MRDKPSIPEEVLQECLRHQYDVSPVALAFLPHGLDTMAVLYRVVSEQGIAYLVKVKSGPRYEPSCLVPRFLWDLGVESVVPPLFTKTNAPWTRLGDWTVRVYTFLDGETGWASMTDENWKATGAIFKEIHEAALPHENAAVTQKRDFRSYAVHWLGG